jgi:competence protein ComEA
MNHIENPQPRRSRAALWSLTLGVVFFAGILGFALRTSAHPQDPATEAFFKLCNDCHEGDRISGTRRTRAAWEDIIVQMIDKGAVGSNQEFTLVLQYLLSHHGMVNINSAEADEMALVTGLTVKETEAIIAYRKANGSFKNYEALIKVPNIDVKKLEERRAALLF